MNLLYCRCGPRVTTPKYMTLGSCAFDLECAETIIIRRHSYEEIQFKIVFKIPKGYVLYVRPRNSTFKNYGLIFVGSGIVDEDYCGPDDQINFPVFNPLDVDVCVPVGARIAQAMLFKIEKVGFVPFVPEGKNRGGTGSTGR